MSSRTLVLMRHARQEIIGGRDHDRPLTPDGRDDARRVGLRLREQGPHPDHALVSTARRCRETWQAVQAALGSSVATDFEDGLYNASAEQLLDAVAAVDEAVETLLVLAHNPGITLLALELAAGAMDAMGIGEGFSPASAACFAIDGPWSTVSSRTASLRHFDRI